jgi:hypothetical protein
MEARRSLVAWIMKGKGWYRSFCGRFDIRRMASGGGWTLTSGAEPTPTIDTYHTMRDARRAAQAILDRVENQAWVDEHQDVLSDDFKILI